HARSHFGLGKALNDLGKASEAEAAFRQGRAAMDALRLGGRPGEAVLAEAFDHSVHGRGAQAVEALQTLLQKAELPFTGWTIPIEPLFEPLHDLPEYRTLLAALAERAR